MKVVNYMTPKVITAKSDDGIRMTFFKMREHNIRHIPVLDEGGKIVGILSDRDLRRPDWVDEDMEISHPYKLDDNLSVKDLMSTNVKFVYTYDSIKKANEYFVATRFGALPVLNREGQVVGMLSTIDVLRAFEVYMEEHPMKG